MSYLMIALCLGYIFSIIPREFNVRLLRYRQTNLSIDTKLNFGENDAQNINNSSSIVYSKMELSLIHDLSVNENNLMLD